MGKLDGKSAIVTGASRGIGAEIARLFAKEGAQTVCAARTLHKDDHQLEGSLEETVQDIESEGGEATAVAVNISIPEDCEKLVQKAIDTYGKVDILVNNAALTYFIPIKDYPLNRWMRSWAVNFHAPFILSQLALKDMIPRHSGSIVNIPSGAAIGPGGQSQYLGIDRYTNTGRWGVFIQRVRFNDDYYFANFTTRSNHDVEITLGASVLRFAGDLDIAGSLEVSRRLNWNFVLENDVTNVKLGLRVGWRGG